MFYSEGDSCIHPFKGFYVFELITSFEHKSNKL